ncbi:MAG: hypothetical protein AAGG46_08760, partial [Planctomycetota bacterium]
MKLHATLTFGLALALFASAGSSSAVNPVGYGVGGPAAAYAAVAPTATQPPAQAQLPVQTTTPAPPNYAGYPMAAAQPAPPAYGATPAPGYSAVAVKPAPVTPASAYAAYSQQVHAAAAVPPSAPLTAPPTAPPSYAPPAYSPSPYAQQPAPSTPPMAVAPVAPSAPVGLGGYPVAPVRVAPVKVAQTLPAPVDAGMQGPAMTAPVGPASPAAMPAPVSPVPADAPAAAPTQSWTGYTTPPTTPAAMSGCDPMSGYGPAACDEGCEAPCDLSAACAPQCPPRQWFVGLYGLLLQRDNPRVVKTAVRATTPGGTNYYPDPSTDTFLLSSQVDNDFQGGAEIRFGSTL